jgi:hypothetical protein
MCINTYSLIERVCVAYPSYILSAPSVASSKRNLMSVGGCADTTVDLVAGGSADGKRPCLGNKVSYRSVSGLTGTGSSR